MFDKSILPDVASQEENAVAWPLSWVGMEKIALPITLSVSEGQDAHVTAMADSFISLFDPLAKGIHMSRLYLKLKEALAHKTIDAPALSQLLADMVASQEGISDAAMLRLSFDLPLEKPALLSGEKGVQAYPVKLVSSLKNGQVTTTLSLTIPYSSTCPCSTALSRQLMASKVGEVFTGETIDRAELLSWLQSKEGSVATPHSQRSLAHVRVALSSEMETLPIDALIDAIEEAVGTPVQSAVKREDEQASRAQPEDRAAIDPGSNVEGDG